MARERHRPARPGPSERPADVWLYPATVPPGTEGGESVWEQWHDASRRMDLAFAPTEPSEHVPRGPEPKKPRPLGLPLTAETVMVEARRHNRVCPQPPIWARLYHSLGGDRYVDLQPPPVQPWNWSKLSNLQKRLRFREHVEWAARHGKLALVATFIAGLAEADWVHMDS